MASGGMLLCMRWSSHHGDRVGSDCIVSHDVGYTMVMTYDDFLIRCIHSDYKGTDPGEMRTLCSAGVLSDPHLPVLVDPAVLVVK